MKRNKMNKSKRTPLRVIAASLLAIVIVVNLVNSTLQNVEAKGMFQTVEEKATAATGSAGKPIKLLEILPDSSSVSMLGMLLPGKEPFQDNLESYSEAEYNEKVKELAELLSKYGIANMDSSSSEMYPLTYYKPGAEERLYSDIPKLTENKKGYGYIDKELISGWFQEVSDEELSQEIVYYQEIIVTVTPEPTAEVTVTPEPTAEVTVTPEPTAEVTVTPEPTAEVTITPTVEVTPTEETEVTITPTAEVTPIEDPEVTVTPTPEPTKAAEVIEEVKTTVTPIPSEQEGVTPEPTEEGEIIPEESASVDVREKVMVETNAESVEGENEVGNTEVDTAAEALTTTSTADEESEVTNTPVENSEETEATVTPEPTEETEATVTPEPTEGAEATVTPEPTEEAEATPETTVTPTPSVTVGAEQPELSEIYFEENGVRVYLKYVEDGVTATGEGRMFRFTSNDGNQQQPEGSFAGQGYRFMFGPKAELRNNDLFRRFVLGISEEAQRQNTQIELTSVELSAASNLNFQEYDLVYIAEPVLQEIDGVFIENISSDTSDKNVSQWTSVSGYTSDGTKQVVDSVAKKLLEGIADQTDPLKVMIDTTILEGYEQSLVNYEKVLEAAESDALKAGTQQLIDGIKENGIYKALLILAQEDFSTIITDEKISNSSTTNGVTTYTIDDTKWNKNVSVDDLRDEIYNEDMTELNLTNLGHYVNKNVYFYKYIADNYDSALCRENIVYSLVNGDFRSTVQTKLLAIAFQDVISAIDTENERNAYLQSDREKIEAEITTDMVLQYLLNYTGQAIEIKKNTISVLEIEPCADFSYDYTTDDSNSAKDSEGNYILNNDGTKRMSVAQFEFINKWIHYFSQENRQKDVTFTCMSIQEFIGKNENLNATYDLIYIGANIGKFQTVNDNGVTRRFNDTSMNGLIYTHIGDLTGRRVDVKNGVGLLDTDYVSNNRANDYKTTGSKPYNTDGKAGTHYYKYTDMRTTGNDLTTYKKRDLLNYLQSGYPVIVSERLFEFEKDAESSSKVPTALNAAGEAKNDEASSTRTVYIRKPKTGFHNAWDDIYIYYWGDSGTGPAHPGVKAGYEISLSEGDYYVYKIDIPKVYDKYIITGKDGADNVKGNTGDREFQSNKDVCTITLVKGSIANGADVIWSDGLPGETGGGYTLDNSTYLYQLLKIATATENSIDLEKVSQEKTYNYQLDGIEFDWKDRTFKNLLTDGMEEQEAHKTAAQFLNETKVFLNLTNRPITYGYQTLDNDGNPIDESKVEYLQAVNGRYYLNYEFAISSLAGTLSTNEYDCKLFVDANFDGKFSENSEELDAVVIKEAASGTIITKEDGSDTYKLRENIAYTLSRKLPKSFDGCINWKLQVTKVGNEDVLAEETGYCAIPVTAKNTDGSIVENGGKQKINILQITSGSSTAEPNPLTRITFQGTHVNLEKQLGDGFTQEKWHNLLKNIPDFELNIKTMSATEFAQKCVEYDNRTNDFGGYAVNTTISEGSSERYDMLIVGFIDVFSETGNKGEQEMYAMAEAINRFGNTGKSILFTHDTTAWNGDYLKLTDETDYWGNSGLYNNAKNSSAYLTIAIRDLCGNDQYGVVTRRDNVTVDTSSYLNYINQFFETPASTGKEYANTSVEWNELVNLGKDMAFKPNTNQQQVVGETQGSTYSNLISYNYKFNDNNVDANDANYYVQYIKDLIPSKRQNTDLFDASKLTNEKFEVGKVNEGAITEYPYDLPDSFDVASTHAQYWTVDIESDTNQDDESDLVVWYCINGRSVKGNSTTAPIDDFYKNTPNDVRNNYYIYNKGNITYSGAGHSPISDENEIKLFINTMIAAYNAKIKIPEVSIVENGETEAPELENVIIPYDKSVSSTDADFVNFGTTNASGKVEGTMRIFFNVYDGNLVAKQKYINVDEIFISDANGSETYIDLDGTVVNGKRYTSSTQLKIYDASDDTETEYGKLKSGHTYYVDAPMSEVFNKNQSVKLYVKIHTMIGEGNSMMESAQASDSVTISRAEIFDLD